MTCHQWEELVAAPPRQKEPPAAAREHLAGCEACRDFAAEWAVVSALLADWQAPVPAERDGEGARAAIVARLVATTARRGHGRPTVAGLLLQHPAVLAVPGALAVIVGAAAAPQWLQSVALGWFAAATGCAALVLLYHGRCAVSEGEGI